MHAATIVAGEEASSGHDPLKTCSQTVYWSAGGYFDGQGQALTHCDGCGEWLGTPFVRAEESHRPVHGAKSRLQLQAS